LSQAPAPANGVATPTSPVLIGAAIPDLALDVPEPIVAVAGVGAIPIVMVGVGIPDVRGSLSTLEALAKATDCVDAVGLGIAVVMLGLRTLKGNVN